MAVEDDIQFERDGHVARIWLNRPHKRNCITVPMLHRLDEIITEIEADADLRVVVVRGRGNTFSSGFDLDSLQAEADYYRKEGFTGMKLRCGYPMTEGMSLPTQNSLAR